MKTYTLSHLSDQTLLRDLAALVEQDRCTTAAMLAHLAEVDARRLYLPAAYPSMYLYCVHELRLPEQAALKRLRAARAARRFPVIFEAVAQGRLHVSGIVLLAPHLIEATADELLTAAANKSVPAIAQIIAERFPQPDVPTEIRAIAPTLPACQLSSRTVGMTTTGQLVAGTGELAVRPVGTAAEQPAARPIETPVSQHAPGHVEFPRPRVAPLSPERFALQVTIGQSTHDKLRHAQALLGHQVPSGDVAQVLDRALDALILTLEKRKFAATDNPRAGRPRGATSARHIPAEVKRAVWKRDQGQCTFVSDSGHRCSERSGLQFDHIDPVARGGHASVSRMRLRCRAHNQYEAERVFGAAFMDGKRQAARLAAAQARAEVERILAAAP